MTCICNAWWLQTEDCPGEFYDPEDKLLKNSQGLKVRVMHNGCPVHNGHSNRARPRDLAAEIRKLEASGDKHLFPPRESPAEGASGVRIERGYRGKEIVEYWLWLTEEDTERWATRAYSHWPASTLRGHRLCVNVDITGLASVTVDDEVWDRDRNELAACVFDHLPEDCRHLWPGPPPVLAEPWLRVTFRDMHGNLIETFEVPAAAALEKTSRFLLVHGTDPDEDGREAMPGTVAFTPCAAPACPDPAQGE